MTLSPAYGRDYTSKKAVEADFKSGKDFIIEDFMHPYSGRPCNVQDLRGEGLKSVQIRYARKRKVCVVSIPKG